MVVNKKHMLNLLCYILIDLVDIFGIMDFFDGYLPFDDPGPFDPYDLGE